MTLYGGTWSCHICGEERPDEHIGVYSEEWSIIDGRGQLTINVRYCSDRADCAAAAPAKAREMAAPALDPVST